MSKRWLIVLLQSLVTIGLLAAFFHDPEFRSRAVEALREADARWLALGVLLAGLENFLGVCRWRIFLRMLGMELPFWKTLQICLVALFCNTFLLGAAGGDLIRAAYLVRRGFSKTNALLSVVMDRVSGLGALIVYTVLLTTWNREWLMHSPTVVLLFKFVILYQLGSVALIGLSLHLAIRSTEGRLPRWAFFPAFIERFGGGFAKLVRDPHNSGRAMALSLLMQALYFLLFYCSARAFNATISVIDLATLMPVVDVISALPISIGGVGVREQIFVVLLGQLAGTPRATAVFISLTGYLLNISWGFVGAAILPWFKGIVKDARRTNE